MKDLDLRVFRINPDGIIRYCMDFKDNKRIYGVDIDRSVTTNDFKLSLTQKSRLSRRPCFEYLREKDLKKLNLDIENNFFDKDLFKGRHITYSSFNFAVKKIKKVFNRFKDAQSYDYDNVEKLGEELLRRF